MNGSPVKPKRCFSITHEADRIYSFIRDSQELQLLERSGSSYFIQNYTQT